jgi:hypothetical protein
MHYLNMEEQRLDKLREEEEARKHEGKLILASLCTCALFYSQHGA